MIRPRVVCTLSLVVCVSVRRTVLGCALLRSLSGVPLAASGRAELAEIVEIADPLIEITAPLLVCGGVPGREAGREAEPLKLELGLCSALCSSLCSGFCSGLSAGGEGIAEPRRFGPAGGLALSSPCES